MGETTRNGTGTSGWNDNIMIVTEESVWVYERRNEGLPFLVDLENDSLKKIMNSEINIICSCFLQAN